MPENQSGTQEWNLLSLAERDRRWQRLRQAMSERGIDCLLVNGSSGRWNEMQANVRYVCNYADNLSTLSYAIFPLDGDGTLVTQMTVKRSNLAQCWFGDIRGLSTPALPRVVEERLTDLNLTGGTLGLAGITFRGNENIGMPWNLLEDIRRRLPNLRIVDVTDLFFELRSVKSDEEIACLAESARLSDLGFEAHVRLARPGITERAFCSGVIEAVNSAGAEPPTFLLLNSGPMPSKALMGDPLPSGRVLQAGDLICSELGPKWAGYQAQISQCISLGRPSAVLQDLHKYACEIFHQMAERVRPGVHHDEVVQAGDEVMQRCRAQYGDLAAGFNPIATPAGLGGPDPEPTSKILQPNQAYNLHIGHGVSQPQHLYGGYTVVVTDREPRHLSRFSIEELMLKMVE